MASAVGRSAVVNRNLPLAGVEIQVELMCSGSLPYANANFNWNLLTARAFGVFGTWIEGFYDGRDADARREFAQDQRARPIGLLLEFDDREIRDDAVNAGDTDHGQAAARDDARPSSPVGVLHHDDHATAVEVEAFEVVAPVLVGQVAARRDLKRAEDRDIRVNRVDRILARVSTRAEPASFEVKNQLGVIRRHPRIRARG